MKDNELRAAPRNPSTAEIRLHCLDMAVRGALLTGRANDFMQQAEQYFGWVTKAPAATKADAAPVATLTIEQALAMVPRELLRTAAELKERGFKRADVIAAAKPPTAPPAAADLDDDDDSSANQGEQGGGERTPASLRQAGG